MTKQELTEKRDQLRKRVARLNIVIASYLVFSPFVVPVIRGPFARWYARVTGADYEMIVEMMWICGLVSLAVLAGMRISSGFELERVEHDLKWTP